MDNMILAITNHMTARAKLHDALLEYTGEVTIDTPVPVYYLDIDTNGMYNREDKLIIINSKLDKADRLLTLAHESRHAYQDSLGILTDTNYYDDDGNLDVVKYVLDPAEQDAKHYELTFINQFVKVLTDEEIAACQIQM